MLQHDIALSRVVLQKSPMMEHGNTHNEVTSMLLISMMITQSVRTINHASHLLTHYKNGKHIRTWTSTTSPCHTTCGGCYTLTSTTSPCHTTCGGCYTLTSTTSPCHTTCGGCYTLTSTTSPCHTTCGGCYTLTLESSERLEKQSIQVSHNRLFIHSFISDSKYCFLHISLNSIMLWTSHMPRDSVFRKRAIFD